VKWIDIKNKSLWGIGSLASLAISYWLCRVVFFDMHGMKQWPNALALVSLIIIIIASVGGSRILSVATNIGYMGGFILGMIFNTDGVDQGGGGTNNGWIIWGVVFIVCLLIGLIADIIYKQKIRQQAND
jgi:hypothetical protein